MKCENICIFGPPCCNRSKYHCCDCCKTLLSSLWSSSVSLQKQHQSLFVKLRHANHTLKKTHCFSVYLSSSLHCGCVAKERQDAVYFMIAEAHPTTSSFGLNKVEKWGLCKKEGKSIQCCKMCMKVLWEPATMCALTGRNAACVIMNRGGVCQWAALHRKAQYTGLIAVLLAHFRPQLKSHCTAGGVGNKRRAQVLKRPPCGSNNIWCGTT